MQNSRVRSFVRSLVRSFVPCAFDFDITFHWQFELIISGRLVKMTPSQEHREVFVPPKF